MLQLLERIEAISACRDREVLAATIVAALHEFLGPRSLMLYRLTNKEQSFFLEELASHDGRQASVGGADGDGERLLPIELQPAVEESLRAEEPVIVDGDGGFLCVYPLVLQNTTTPYGFIKLCFDEMPAREACEALGWLLRFYTNYLSLLDYSELDTLTGLLNRKTFDEVFDKILARLPANGQKAPGAERRNQGGECDSHWLAVIDIDHFKRINDNFGHLFGDEVLLRLGNLMRATFRKHDFLFRFGGEEFIVVLRPTTQVNAAQAFERFRSAVEAHEFPQVGRVTCSIGFTQVLGSVAPIELVGRADQALYFAKENGRNSVYCFENLVEQGLLAEQVGAVPEDLDIDALFC